MGNSDIEHSTLILSLDGAILLALGIGQQTKYRQNRQYAIGNRDIGHSTLILSFHGAILQALLPTKELLNVKFHRKIPVSMKFIFPGMELVLFSVLHFELCTFVKLFTSPPENV